MHKNAGQLHLRFGEGNLLMRRAAHSDSETPTSHLDMYKRISYKGYGK
jgi:hypothetical protein